MAVKFGIRDVTRVGNDLTFTVYALNADDSIDTAYTGAFTFGLNNLTGPSGYTFVAGDNGQRTFTATINNPAVRGGLAANFPGSQTGANLSVSGPNGSNTSFGNQGNHFLLGGTGVDTLTSNVGNDLMFGLDGNDILNGNGGNDVIDGGTGADTMTGGAGNDIFIVDDLNDVVNESVGGGTDRVETSVASYTLPDNVEFLEYVGKDAVTFTGNAGANVLVGGEAGDTLSGLDGDDTLGGEAGNDVLNGGEGSDRLFGGVGGDTMNGEGGNDRMAIDDGADLAFGGDGIDTVQFVAAGISYTIANDVEIVSNQSGGALTVTLNALANTFGGSATGADTVNAGDGQDSVYGRGGNDVLRGEGNNDYLFGEAGADQLYGGDGVDLLYGGADLDLLFGDAGNDTLYGEAGSDFLTGGAGFDQLFGGLGTDFFVFFDGDSGNTLATADRIRDFNQAQGDRIQLDGIDAIAGGGDDAFSFIGSAAFSNVAGQLRVEVVGGETRVSGDTDGDGVADFLIRIDGVHALGAGDFVL